MALFDVNRFDRNRFRALVSAFMLSAVLAGCGGGGGDGAPAAMNPGPTNPPTPMVMMQTFTTGTPTAAERTGTGGNDVFTITGDITGNSPALVINGVIDGGGDTETDSRDSIFGDIFRLDGGVVNNIAVSASNPAPGDVHLQNIETIQLRSGNVNNITGSAGNAEIFTVSGDLTSNSLNITGIIDGGMGGGVAGNRDSFTLGSGGVVRNIAFSASPPAAGDVHLQNIEVISVSGGTVRGNITGSAGNEFFAITGDLTSDDLSINGIIDGGDGDADTFLLGIFGVSGFFGVVRDIVFSQSNLNADDVHLQNIEGISLFAGTVRNITGSAGSEQFFIVGDLTSNDLNITGIIDGGGNSGTGFFPDTFSLSLGGVVNNIAVSASNPTAGDVHLQNIPFIYLTIGTVMGNITGSANSEVFFILGDLTSDDLNITGIIDGGVGGGDAFMLGSTIVPPGVPAVIPGVVRDIAFSTSNPAAGDVHLQNIGRIGLVAGTVRNITGSAGVDTFDLQGGTVTGNLLGGGDDDIFNLQGGMISGHVDGGPGTDTIRLLGTTFATDSYISGGTGADVLEYAGASSVPGGVGFNGRDGLSGVSSITDPNTNGDVRDFGSQRDPTGPGTQSIAGAALPRVSGIEVLSLSPALNLYGAMSDALMQFGQQTAQGFALADLNLATGRGTSLVSKDSPFSKGRIWAHKITHSGNGKGSIGLNLTGLTARAESDYDYEMSLTQHGFDAPVATTKLGAFNLRAVSHTMTGVIETNVAEAQVSGYGAGVALLWRSNSLSAHITSLAGAYEVEAHTSPLNPQAVVSEVLEGSFSAINAVVSAGVADTRKLSHSLVLRTTADIVWQTLSLDDFSETGPDGIIINFDKATRFTARVGAGLESEHWFSDVAFVHETSSGGTLSSGLSQDYRQDDGTAFEMKLGGKIADLATGLTLKAYAGIRKSLISSDAIEPSGHLTLNWRF